MPDLTPEDLDRMRAQAVSPSHGAWTEDAVDRLIVLVAAEYEKRIAELEEALRELVTLKDGDDGWPPHGRCDCDHHTEYCSTCFPADYQEGGKFYGRHKRWPAAWAAARSLLAQGGEQKESTHGKV
jgi:hypothetical protein